MSSKDSQTKSSEGGIGEFIKVILQAGAIALIVQTFLFKPFNIPSGSLIPTLLVGDYVMVSKFSYGFSKYSLPYAPDLFSGRIWGSSPQRGDIAVFNNKLDAGKDYIKRVIGLPGDRIQMKEGRLYINGKMVERVADGTRTITDSYGRTREVPLYKETLPEGVVHQIMEEEGDTGFLDETEEYVVPADHYFMMGDNRDNSQDSRVLTTVGYVPFESFVGKAQIVFFSVDDTVGWKFWTWPWTVRFSRLFHWVR